MLHGKSSLCLHNVQYMSFFRQFCIISKCVMSCSFATLKLYTEVFSFKCLWRKLMWKILPQPRHFLKSDWPRLHATFVTSCSPLPHIHYHILYILYQQQNHSDWVFFYVALSMRTTWVMSGLGGNKSQETGKQW